MVVFLTGPVTDLCYSNETDWRIGTSMRLGDAGIVCSWSTRMRDYEGFRESSALLWRDRCGDPSRLENYQGRNALARSDVLLVNFECSPHQPALGACIEIGMADAWGIPVIAAISPEGVHDHLAVLASCTDVVQTLEEAEDHVKRMAARLLR